jgi:hypothetical protein
MKVLKLSMLAVLCALLNISAIAQSSDEYNKMEGSAGYSHQWIDSDDAYKGFEVSATRNFTRYLGVKGSFSGAYKTFDPVTVTVFPAPPITFRIKESVYQYMGGIQVKDNRKEGSRFRPFAHALAGGATFRQKVSGTCPTPSSVCSGINNSDSGFAGAFGGGLDIKVNKRFSVRAIQADYNPFWFNGGAVHNFRLGVGIVIH